MTANHAQALPRLNDLFIHPFIWDNRFGQKLFKRNAKKIDLLMGDPNYEERKNQSRGSPTYQLHADATRLDIGRGYPGGSS